jgi:hypothetical protein
VAEWAGEIQEAVMGEKQKEKEERGPFARAITQQCSLPRRTFVFSVPDSVSFNSPRNRILR